MNDDIEAAAAERFERFVAGEPTKEIYGDDQSRWPDLFADDTEILSRAYIRRLTADRAEREERRIGDVGASRLAANVFLAAFVMLGLWRVLVPTSLDVSATSLHKDAAHLLVGLGLGYAMRHPRSWDIVVGAVLVSLWELGFFLATR